MPIKTRVQPNSARTSKQLPGDPLDLVLDFSQASSGFEPLPAGTYLAKIVKAEIGLSKAQKPKIAIEMLVEEPSDFEGRKIFANPSLAPNALFNAKNLLEAFEISPDSVKSGKTLQKKLQEILNETVGVVLKVTETNQNDVVRYLAASKVTL